MRTTINLDDEVLAAAKAKVRMSGSSLGKVLSQWARIGMLGKEGAKENKQQKSKLPHFQVNKQAAIIPSDRASDLIDEEG